MAKLFKNPSCKGQQHVGGGGAEIGVAGIDIEHAADDDGARSVGIGPQAGSEN
jgi:hypothetical protein